VEPLEVSTDSAPEIESSKKIRFDWRGKLLEFLRTIPTFLILIQLARTVPGSRLPDLTEAIFQPSSFTAALLGALIGAVLFEAFGFVVRELGRRLKRPVAIDARPTGSIERRLTTRDELFERRSGGGKAFSGELPFSLLLQAFVLSITAYSVLCLSACWIFNELSRVDIPYLVAALYALVLAWVGFYGERSDRAIRLADSMNRIELGTRLQDQQAIGEWIEMKPKSVANTLWLVSVCVSLYLAFNEQNPNWIWLAVLSFVSLNIFMMWLFLRDTSKSRQRATTMATSDESPEQ